MIRLLFTVPVSNNKNWKECFPNWNMLKSISVFPLVSNTWKIFWELSNRTAVLSAMNKWNFDKVRCATKEKGPWSYKSRNSAKVNVKYLCDDDNYDEEENSSENGEEGYFFSSDSE